MTPKKKAKELFLKFRQIPPFSPYTGIDDGEAKQCALVAVDEILDDYLYMQNIRNANSNQIHSRRVYWQEVKQEIEKL